MFCLCVVRAVISALSLQDVCSPPASKYNVTVIGNGHIPDEQRSMIRSSKCVIRFNDMKNYRQGEPFDALALREHTMARSRMHKKTTIPVISSDLQLDKLSGKHLAPIYVTQHQYHLKPKYEDLRIFEGCNESKLHRKTLKGPSTGAAVIDFLQRHDNVTYIYVYGMNWHGTKDHVDFKYSNMVPNCCTKCIIYSTQTNRYY